MSDLVGNPEDRFSRVAAHVLQLYPIWQTLLPRLMTACRVLEISHDTFNGRPLPVLE